MDILVMDDELLLLDSMVQEIKTAIPIAKIHAFLNANELLEFARNKPCAIAFLDTQIRGTSGIEVAKKLKDITPKINIIFVTSDSEHALEAIKLRVSGYLVKPITAEDVISELAYLRYPLNEKTKKRISVQTFGNFEVFCDNRPVRFNRSKSKEILAFLIDKQGTSATSSEIATVIWEDGVYDRSRQKQLQTCISDMKKALVTVGAEDIIIKSRKSLMVDRTKFDCDLYEFLQGDISAINSYMGQYMSAYSWAEFTAAYLDGAITLKQIFQMNETRYI